MVTLHPFLDRNSKVVFSVVWNFLKSVHSVHSVHVVCTGLPPDDLYEYVPVHRSTYLSPISTPSTYLERTFFFLSTYLVHTRMYCVYKIIAGDAV